MKQIILFVFSFYSIAGYAQDKLIGDYSSDYLSKGNFYYISLYENGNYSLFLSERITIDIITDRAISFGNYHLKDSIITFDDQIFNFTMKAQLISNKIIFNQSFHILKDVPFSFSGDSHIDYFEPQMQEKQKSQQSLFPFNIGIYKDKNDEYTLSFEDENRYTLYYKNNLFLEGSWKKEGSQIQLYDSSIQHSFYISIGENKLIAKYLPGEYSHLELIYSPLRGEVSPLHNLNINHDLKFFISLLFPFLFLIFCK